MIVAACQTSTRMLRRSSRGATRNSGWAPRRRTVHSQSASKNPDSIQAWLDQNLEIVRHAMEGGNFPTNQTSNHGYSFSDYNRVYAPTAEYHDLFIRAHGRAAVLCSFQIIARVWKIQLPHDFGTNKRLVTVQDDGLSKVDRNTRDPSETVAIVRLPFRIHQQLKLAPSMVQSHYNGYVDLRLQQTPLDDKNTGLSLSGTMIV